MPKRYSADGNSGNSSGNYAGGQANNGQKVSKEKTCLSPHKRLMYLRGPGNPTRMLVNTPVSNRHCASSRQRKGWSLRTMDMLASLDLDVCGKYIWSKVPADKVLMVLSMRDGLVGGVSSNLNFKTWMMDSLEKNVIAFENQPRFPLVKVPAPHVLELNKLAGLVYVSPKPFSVETPTATKSSEAASGGASGGASGAAINPLDEDYMLETISQCLEVGLRLNVTLSQCPCCSEVPNILAGYSSQCTNTLKTCKDVAECLASVLKKLRSKQQLYRPFSQEAMDVDNSVEAEEAQKITLFKVAVKGVNFHSSHSNALLTALSDILDAATTVHSLQLSNIYSSHGTICRTDEEEFLLWALGHARRVEVLEFRDIHLFKRRLHTLSVVQSGPDFVYLGTQSMPLEWLRVVHAVSSVPLIKSLTIRNNTFLQGELGPFTELLLKCPSLEEMHFPGGIHPGYVGNMGIWVLTAISNRYKQYPEATKLGNLKVITLDMGKPALQITPLGPGQTLEQFAASDVEFPKTWQDTYPAELLDVQLANLYPVGGDMSCLVDEVMPSLDALHIRTGADLSMLQCIQLLHAIRAHRKQKGNTRKIKNLYIYSVHCHEHLMSPTSALGKKVLQCFEKIHLRPLRVFPFVF